MNIFDELSENTSESVDDHKLKTITVLADNYDQAVEAVVSVVPDHYIDPESIAHILERLGKPEAAQKLRTKLPETKNIRSGDLGEILGTEYINNQTQFTAPINKLRWKDHREMAMRGEDVIGIKVFENGQRPNFLKTEAKSRAQLSTLVLEKARTALDSDGGQPAPHALAFIADRLRDCGNVAFADIIDDAQLKNGITKNQMEHLLFTFTGSNPHNLQKTVLEAYDGEITQHAVGLRVARHQEFIADVFDEVEDGHDN